MKAIWTWCQDWDYTEELVDGMLADIVAAGFDTVLWYVGCGTVTYPSELIPRSPFLPATDTLAYLVPACHNLGLDVYAWWCPGEAPDSAAFRAEYPTWDVAIIDGIPADDHWLNFNLSAVRQFCSDVLCEIIDSYNVDGVHLDYIRFEPPPPWGNYDPADYFEDTDVPDTVELCFDDINGEVPLTAAVLSSQGSSTSCLQNWADWLTGEYIDRVMPMAYYVYGDTYRTNEDAKLERDVEQWIVLDNPNLVVPGLWPKCGGETMASNELLDQVNVCKANGYTTELCIFDISSTLQADYIEALHDVAFQPTPGHSNIWRVTTPLEGSDDVAIRVTTPTNLFFLWHDDLDGLSEAEIETAIDDFCAQVSGLSGEISQLDPLRISVQWSPP